MLISFWVIAALMAVLMFKNARYAVGQYFADRNRMLLTLYFSLLIVFAYLVLRLTFHVIDFVQSEQQSDGMQPTAYVSSRLRGAPPPTSIDE